MKSTADIDAGWELPEDESRVIFINGASFDQLCALPGIGNSKARRIIEWRGKNGPIADLDALLAVEGIGQSTLGRLGSFVA